MESDGVLRFFKGNALILSLFIAGVFFLVFGLLQSFSTQKSPVVMESQEASVNTSTDEVYVDVSGAVKNPGVYAMPANARIQDALDKAGGIDEQADIAYLEKYINRAQTIKDGEKIFIPSLNSQSSESAEELGHVRINVNTADAKALELLPGIGPVSAQKVIDGRPYSRVEDLLERNAVSSATFEKIKDQISVY
jgi:competence protein ComEA